MGISLVGFDLVEGVIQGCSLDFISSVGLRLGLRHPASDRKGCCPLTGAANAFMG